MSLEMVLLLLGIALIGWGIAIIREWPRWTFLLVSFVFFLFLIGIVLVLVGLSPVILSFYGPA